MFFYDTWAPDIIIKAGRVTQKNNTVECKLTFGHKKNNVLWFIEILKCKILYCNEEWFFFFFTGAI